MSWREQLFEPLSEPNMGALKIKYECIGRMPLNLPSNVRNYTSISIVKPVRVQLCVHLLI